MNNVHYLHRVVPIPSDHMGEPIDLYESFSHERIRDPAMGGKAGFVFMVLVAAVIGVMLAVGGF